MGNLESDSIVGTPDTSKGVVSVWVFVPAETAEAAEEGFSGDGVDYEVFNGTIPLITWGDQQTGTIYEWFFPPVVVEDPADPENFGPYNLGNLSLVTGSHSNYRPPSYIGIKCEGGELSVQTNFQSSTFPSCANTSVSITDIHLNEPSGPYTIGLEATDASYTDEGTPTFFGGTSLAAFTTDAWHHILISWDFTGGCSVMGTGTTSSDPGAPYGDYVTSDCKMWFSLDDENKHSTDLPALWIGDNGGDADNNVIITELCASFSGEPLMIIDSAPTDIEFGNPSVSESVDIPVSPISVPSSLAVNKPTDSVGGSTTVSPNLLIRMAEMQVFFGVTLDTSVEANRRAFITESGRPASPSLAADLLEQAPHVHFKTHTDFITGNNRGSAGDFTPTGTINPFSPGP